MQHPTSFYLVWRRLGGVALLAGATLLSGCDMLSAVGIVTPGQKNAAAEAESKAIGGACRHAMRSIEDCYRDNPKAAKAQVFDGWREMDVYMRENEIQGMPSAPPPPVMIEETAEPAPAESKDKNGKADKPTGK